MTPFRILAFLALPLLALGLQGCPQAIVDPVVSSGYSAYTPILMTRSQLENSISPVADKAVTNPAKIFILGSRIYMTERYKGIYIVDNADPANPRSLGFIAIPGLNDAVVKEGVLIADNAVDLVGIDIADPAHPEVLWRRRNVLSQVAPPDRKPSKPINADPSSIIVEWVKN